ncbi:integrase [Luteibacter aegosomatis]|uniref:site-specific integrase n=1 Tax=Luteibacter aegosomatis TaxID=2911537 RepID=UPI001FFBCF00|nr:site-specific integrase [Luteibacter aegosomatis]UPG84530.1 integrase [Luteibacter aegosomatis]
MRLPNYLHLSPSGIWHFRQRVPADLIPVLGKRFFKQSLKTRHALSAQRIALSLADRYARLIERARGMRVSDTDGPSADDVVKFPGKKIPYRLVRHPDGTVEIEAKGPADHGLAMNAAERIGIMALEPTVQQAIRDTAAREAKALEAATRPSVPVLPIGKAVAQWLADIKPNTLRKTHTIKAAAVEGFARHYGVKNPLHDAGRIDVGQWIESLRASGLQTPTIANKAGYLRGFFDWAKARGYYPAFAKDDNPAAGQILYRTREKRARRVLGFKAFGIDQIRILFSPEALDGLSEAARWGAWIGLYTGARVAEVGQLALADFIMEDGIPCIRITNEGTGQSVKNDASLRTIPVHPALIELGLLDRVAMLKASGETRLFPKVKVDGVNGAGNWLSKAFTRHVEKNLVLPEKGKFGFHSLRKSVVQGLQTAGVSSEHRAAYVGHELGDEHHGTYSRKPTMGELVGSIRNLAW